MNKPDIYVVRENELTECINLDASIIEAVENAFTALQQGRATVPPIMMIPVPERNGEVDVKSAFIQGLDSLAVKVASGFFENHTLGLPSASGLMLVISSVTGFLEAVLLDNGYLTQVRTGAAGAVAAKYLAPPVVENAGVIGAGMQARFQMRGLFLVRPFKRIFSWSPDSDEVRDAYVSDMSAELGVEVIKAESAEEVVRECQSVTTTTPARTPLIKGEWLHRGLHITAMGSDTEEKQELEASVFSRADLVACDLKKQCYRLGELRSAKAAGTLGDDAKIVELGELTSGAAGGRSGEDQITLCDLTGVGIQDTAIALEALRRIKAAGKGMIIN
jgi:ectoine utilization protein EutC